MKSSAMDGILFGQRRRRGNRAMPQPPLEIDPDEDEQPAGDLERVERLGEQAEREEDRDERYSGERQYGADPEGARQPREPEDERDDRDEDRRRPEQERHRRRPRELEAVDEGDLIGEDHRRRDGDEVPILPRDPERALA